MESSKAHVSKESLEELKNELLSMSEQLRNIYEMVNQSLETVHAHWQDGQYEQFAEVFSKPQAKIQELSEKYASWANDYIQKRIDKTGDIGSVSFG